MQINEVFDATNIPPQQVGGRHPIGNKWDFQIANTAIEETSNKEGGMFVVTFVSSAGQIVFRYNLWNKSDQARKIAQGQLSALCHAIGIFQINFANEGANIRGARCKGDVGFQAGHEPTAEKPEGGYVEIKKIYDMNGIEPGQSGNVASQANPAGGTTGGQTWGGGNGATQQQVNQQQPNPNTQQQQTWNNNQQQPNNTQQSQQGGWQQNAGGAATGAAPWKQ